MNGPKARRTPHHRVEGAATNNADASSHHRSLMSVPLRQPNASNHNGSSSSSSNISTMDFATATTAATSKRSHRVVRQRIAGASRGQGAASTTSRFFSRAGFAVLMTILIVAYMVAIFCVARKLLDRTDWEAQPFSRASSYLSNVLEDFRDSYKKTSTYQNRQNIYKKPPAPYVKTDDQKVDRSDNHRRVMGEREAMQQHNTTESATKKQIFRISRKALQDLANNNKQDANSTTADLSKDSIVQKVETTLIGEQEKQHIVRKRRQRRQEIQGKEQTQPKLSPIRVHHLENTLGQGVDPHILLVHPDHDQDSLPLALKNDLPVDVHPTPDTVLAAYLEPIHFEDWTKKPLPNRTYARAENLKKRLYPRLYACSKLPQQWPVDIDDTPTEEDPFLPWIHDVFPTADGRYIQFVAQNRRRCRTGKENVDIMHLMEPQNALFQHVSVQRIKVSVEATNTTTFRYRLVSHDKADPDGLVTRFICRFKPSMVETLSVFNIDYDWTAYRKGYQKTVSKEDGGTKSIHTSQMLFKCPVPHDLHEIVRSGGSVVNDWATLFVDLIPIRTPPRYGLPNQYLAPWYKDLQEKRQWRFKPYYEWGPNHVLPAIDDSGRWENIPICKPSLMTYEKEESLGEPSSNENGDSLAFLAAPDIPHPRRHRLVSCLWASTGYTTRGNRFAVNDGQRRLLEWITYNKMIGFDHFYLYDNSGALSNETSLKPIADLFPGDITYIPWPSQVCNNNPNNVDSPGERSSQYAAESSCLLRFGPHVDWIGQFDIDEYLVPMGNHDNILSLLDQLEEEDTRIISFGSWRAWPRRALIEEPEPIHDPDICWSTEPCFHLHIPMNVTMLQAYNCDRQPPGQKTEQMPAEKQLYMAKYVLQHFVHYSAATTQSEKNMTFFIKDGFRWGRRSFPDPRQRFADELLEGLMIHTKAVAHQDTAGWQEFCHVNNTLRPPRKRGMCRLGYPWPLDPTTLLGTELNIHTVLKNHSSAGLYANATMEGWQYNCFINPKVEDHFVPQLVHRLQQRHHQIVQESR